MSLSSNLLDENGAASSFGAPSSGGGGGESVSSSGALPAATRALIPLSKGSSGDGGENLVALCLLLSLLVSFTGGSYGGESVSRSVFD